MVVPLLKKWEHRGRRMDERIRDGIRSKRERLAEEEMNRDESPDPQKPVAYDANGQPLYAAPTNQMSAQPIGGQAQIVHVARATEPLPVEVSEETRQRHEESKRRFPWLNLSDHEYVINAIPRHGIGMWTPIGITTLAVALVFVTIFSYGDIAASFNLPLASFGIITILGLLLVAAFLIGGYLAIWVYINNRFFLTNESVIQEIQTTIFSKREQTVSLMNVEDASYSQKGPLQHILNYGSIRLSTEGEETTYRFDYVASPKDQIAILNNAVEAFKNGRPVDMPTVANDRN